MFRQILYFYEVIRFHSNLSHSSIIDPIITGQEAVYGFLGNKLDPINLVFRVRIKHTFLRL